MNYVIAVFQLGEINVEGRTRRLRMRRFQPARTLHLVTAENLRVGDDNQLAFVIKKAACQSANVERGSFRTQAIFLPNLSESLAFAIVIAKDVHCVILTQPSM